MTGLRRFSNFTIIVWELGVLKTKEALLKTSGFGVVC